MEIDLRNLPKGYIFCFNSDCPLHEECLRWKVSNQMVFDELTAQVVLPHVARLGECAFFTKAELLRMAWGFDHLFAEVKRKDDGPLRDAMKRYLGGNGTYSRYKLGRRLLTPTQQEYIINLFRKRGYTENLVFDHYVMAFDFDH